MLLLLLDTTRYHIMNRKFTRLLARFSHSEGNSTQDRFLLRSALVITTGIGLQSRITLVYMWELLRNAAGDNDGTHTVECG
jgi:hypothetical protein